MSSTNRFLRVAKSEGVTICILMFALLRELTSTPPEKKKKTPRFGVFAELDHGVGRHCGKCQPGVALLALIDANRCANVKV